MEEVRTSHNPSVVGSIPTGPTKKLVDWNLPPLSKGLRICSE